MKFSNQRRHKNGLLEGEIRRAPHCVNVMRDVKKPNYVKTGGSIPLTKQLYDFRKKSTHYFSLSMMATGPSLPEDFHFGSTRGEGTPVMPLCREVLGLIQRVQMEIDE